LATPEASQLFRRQATGAGHGQRGISCPAQRCRRRRGGSRWLSERLGRAITSAVVRTWRWSERWCAARAAAAGAEANCRFRRSRCLLLCIGGCVRFCGNGWPLPMGLGSFLSRVVGMNQLAVLHPMAEVGWQQVPNYPAWASRVQGSCAVQTQVHRPSHPPSPLAMSPFDTELAYAGLRLACGLPCQPCFPCAPGSSPGAQRRLIALAPAPALCSPCRAGSMRGIPRQPALGDPGLARGWLAVVSICCLGSLVTRAGLSPQAARGFGEARGGRRDLRTSGVSAATGRWPGLLHHRRRLHRALAVLGFSASFAPSWLTPAAARSASVGTHHRVDHQPAGGSAGTEGAISLGGTLAAWWAVVPWPWLLLGPGPALFSAAVGLVTLVGLAWRP